MRTDPLSDALRDLVRDAVREGIAEAIEELRASVVQSPPARYLTVAEAALVANIGQTKLRAAIAAGELDAVRRGRLVRIPTDALDDWLQSA
jgi:excisionase family DNA binding protein